MLFSLGWMLSKTWRAPFQMAPWLASAFVLSVLGCWDLFRGFGRADFILLGLAGYELVIGLTENDSIESRVTAAVAADGFLRRLPSDSRSRT